MMLLHNIHWDRENYETLTLNGVSVYVEIDWEKLIPVNQCHHMIRPMLDGMLDAS